MAESEKSESVAGDSDIETPAGTSTDLTSIVAAAAGQGGVKPMLFTLPSPSGLCTPTVFLVNMLDYGKFQSPLMQVGGISASPTVYQLPVASSAGSSNTGSSYATLAPLQPLPPISAVSDKLNQTSALPFGSNFAFIPNGAAGSAINLQSLNAAGTGAAGNVPGTPLLLSPSAYSQIQMGGYPYALYDPSLLFKQSSIKAEDKVTTDGISNSVAGLVQVQIANSQFESGSVSALLANSPSSSSKDIKNIADSTTPTSCSGSNQPPAVDLPPGVEINTRELAQRINSELKQYGIPQSVFAQKVLGRSQGTLSDLLRNPKPWSKLKAGRETFARMWKWLQEPDADRVTTLKLLSSGSGSAQGSGSSSKPSSSGGEGKRKESQSSISDLAGSDGCSPSTTEGGGAAKKSRLVFTDIQRRTLLAIFKETKRPSRDMQVTIAEQLGLKPSTVSNFFMNARRRSIDKYREDDDMGDESAAVAASPASPLATPFSPRATPLELLATPTSSLASPISLLTLPTATGLDAPSINLVAMPTSSLAMPSSSAPVCLKTEAK